MTTLVLPKRLHRTATLAGLKLVARHGKREGALTLILASGTRTTLRVRAPLLDTVLGLKIGSAVRVSIDCLEGQAPALVAIQRLPVPVPA
jgi:hypothetical protein